MSTFTPVPRHEWLGIIDKYFEPSRKCDADNCFHSAALFGNFHGCIQSCICQHCWDAWYAWAAECIATREMDRL